MTTAIQSKTVLSCDDKANNLSYKNSLSTS